MSVVRSLLYPGDLVSFIQQGIKYIGEVRKILGTYVKVHVYTFHVKCEDKTVRLRDIALFGKHRCEGHYCVGDRFEIGPEQEKARIWDIRNENSEGSSVAYLIHSVNERKHNCHAEIVYEWILNWARSETVASIYNAPM